MGSDEGKGAAGSNCLEVPEIDEEVCVVAWEEFKGEVSALVWLHKVCRPSTVDSRSDSISILGGRSCWTRVGMKDDILHCLLGFKESGEDGAFDIFVEVSANDDLVAHGFPFGDFLAQVFQKG